MGTSFSLEDSTIGIVGLGLMGGSLALALRGSCRALIGCDLDPATLEAACQGKIIDMGDSEPASVLPGADLIILAAPVPAILTLLAELPSMRSASSVVIDIGSVKGAIVAAMERLPERFEPIGGHPLCGKETLSLANADRDLFQGAPFLLTPMKRTTPRALSAAHQVIEAIGARAIIIDAAEHDRLLAWTSHMPYLLSSALSLAVPAAFGPFIGPGFRSTGRLAGTPASMMLGVLDSNRENVLEALAGLQSRLNEIESALASGDLPKLEGVLNQARANHRRLI